VFLLKKYYVSVCLTCSFPQASEEKRANSQPAIQRQRRDLTSGRVYSAVTPRSLHSNIALSFLMRFFLSLIDDISTNFFLPFENRTCSILLRNSELLGIEYSITAAGLVCDLGTHLLCLFWHTTGVVFFRQLSNVFQTNTNQLHWLLSLFLISKNNFKFSLVYRTGISPIPVLYTKNAVFFPVLYTKSASNFGLSLCCKTKIRTFYHNNYLCQSTGILHFCNVFCFFD
jgi:hypothetical protein